MGSPDDATVDDRSEFLQLLDTALMISFCGIGIAAPQNRILEMFPECCGRTQDAFVDKMHQREVLQKIVLERVSGERVNNLNFSGLLIVYDVKFTHDDLLTTLQKIKYNLYWLAISVNYCSDLNNCYTKRSEITTNLDRCAGQKNSPFSFETHERLVRLVLGVL